jgi:2-iminobutanoate/2-iminopropanoate deaminase
MREIIAAQGAPGAIGPYSQAVKSSGLIFCSGQIPLDPATGKVVEGGIEEQTDRVMKNLEAVLAAGGATFGQVLKTTVYMADLSEFPRMNAVYGKYFPATPPARATVQVAGLPLGVKVEIDAVASAEIS